MTIADYRGFGFEVSQYIEQSAIDRAERDVTAAYLEPLGLDAEYIPNVPSLVYLLLLQRSIFATRAGAKIKQTAESRDAGEDFRLRELASTCVLELQRAAAVSGGNVEQVTDICKIFFKTNYFYL